ncbi:MAG: MFS transporter, partial [Cucumibacter sp.]
MRLPGRLAAAIEVLTDLETRHRPAAEALKDWGIAHRFAGSGDRAAIGNLVYDALRKRLSSAHFAGADTPRAAILAIVIREWGETPDTLAAAFGGDRFAPAVLSDEAAAAFTRPNPFAGAPGHVA